MAKTKASAKPASKNILSTRGKTKKFFYVHDMKEIKPCQILDLASSKFCRFMGAVYSETGVLVVDPNNVPYKWANVPKVSD